ncbi:MAG: hypothetical protein MSS75_04575 [Megasphaera sp.]|uniref:hypothetical protein n=1 Tax=Megasphaera sp. TaxID=2023260 RepID=UPI0025B96110|nr:hypothetical protein [Megasphaera sp.]MCI7600305.1 hypothetical protein [Megasphaera sp.]
MRKRVLTLWDGKVFLALVVLAGCIMAAVAAYQHLYMKTPDYAVSQVIRAVRDGDIETFSRHVDEEALSGQFFDALVSHTSDSTDESFLLNIIRSPLRSSFVATADLYLDESLTGDTDNDEYQKTTASLQRTLKSAGLSIPLAGWHLDGADWSHGSTVKLYLYNDRLGATVPCTVTLEQTPSQTWRITGLADPEAFLNDLRDVMKKELAAYNKPVQQKIDAVMTVRDISSKIVTGQGRTFLRLSYTPVFRKDRNAINTVKAVYTLRRDSDKAVLYTSPLRLSTSAEKRTHESQFLLNPLIPSQYSLIRSQALDGMTGELHITAITLKDGSEFALADALPEK